MIIAKELIVEGKAKASDFPADTETEFKPAQTQFIDGITYDVRKPNEYLAKFPLG